MPASDTLDAMEWKPRPLWWRVLRILLGLSIIAALLLAALYFAFTNASFLKRVVLPRLSQTWNVQITAADLSVEPLSSVELRQFRLETEGPEPLFEAQRVLLRYRPWGLLMGRLDFPEIVVEAPRGIWVRQPDGKTNLDPLRDALEKRPRSALRGAPPEMDIGRITVTNGVLRFLRLAPDGSSQLSEISALDLDLEELGNEKESKLAFRATVAHTAAPASGLTNVQGRLQAALAGGFTATLDKRLRATSARGDARLTIAQSTGTLSDLAGLVGTLACDFSANEVRDLSARFERDGQSLGVIRVRGPMDLARSEARLSLDVTSIDRNVLDLVGAPFGLDFLDTKINVKTTLDVSRGGDLVALTGRWVLEQFSVRHGATASAPVDLDLDSHLTITEGEESAILHRFTLTGRQAQRELLSAVLDNPMYLTWGRLPQGVNQSTVRIAVHDLRLRDWALFLGTTVPAGILSATSAVTCQLSGRRFTADLAGELRDAEWELAGRRFDRGSLRFTALGNFSDYRSFLFERFTAHLGEEDVPLAAVTGSAGYDLATRDSNVQFVSESGVPQFLSQFPVPRLSASSGRVTADGLFAQNRGQRAATLNINLRGFSGAYDLYRFDNHDARIEVGVESTGQELTLRRLQLASRQGIGAFGGVDFAGNYNLSTDRGEYKININGLSEAILQPLLAPYLSPVRLLSARFTGDGIIQRDPVAGTSVQLQTRLTGLRVSDPAGLMPTTPLDMEFSLNGSLSSNLVDLTELALRLPPTPRATNQMVVRGRIDLAPPSGWVGQVRVSAEALDWSEILDAHTTNQAATAVPAPPAQAATPPADAAPPPPGGIKLPIRECTVDWQIGRLHAKDAVLSNWTARAKLANNILVIDPFQLTANGAPLAAVATIDASTPAPSYNVRVQSSKLPLGPWVDAFAPDRKGQITGDLDAHLQFAGTGRDGASLRQSLAGIFDLGCTNLTLATTDIRTPLLKSLLHVLERIPELTRDPTTALAPSTSPSTVPSREGDAAWAAEIAKAPIQLIAARGRATSGRVELESGRLQSAAFLAEGQGAITLAPVLGDSPLEIPVRVFLSRPLAAKTGFVPPGATADEPLVKLPDFVTFEGTLKELRTRIDGRALAGAAPSPGTTVPPTQPNPTALPNTPLGSTAPK